MYSGAVVTIASTPSAVSRRAVSAMRGAVSSIAPAMIGTRPPVALTIVRTISTRCASVKYAVSTGGPEGEEPPHTGGDEVIDEPLERA